MVGTGPRGSVSALARVCVVNAQGNVVMDTFVKPNEKVTDYRCAAGAGTCVGLCTAWWQRVGAAAL